MFIIQEQTRSCQMCDLHAQEILNLEKQLQQSANKISTLEIMNNEVAGNVHHQFCNNIIKRCASHAQSNYRHLGSQHDDQHETACNGKNNEIDETEDLNDDSDSTHSDNSDTTDSDMEISDEELDDDFNPMDMDDSGYLSEEDEFE